MELNKGKVMFGSPSYHEKIEVILASEEPNQAQNSVDPEVDIYGAQKTAPNNGYQPVSGNNMY